MQFFLIILGTVILTLMALNILKHIKEGLSFSDSIDALGDDILNVFKKRKKSDNQDTHKEEKPNKETTQEVTTRQKDKKDDDSNIAFNGSDISKMSELEQINLGKEVLAAEGLSLEDSSQFPTMEEISVAEQLIRKKIYQMIIRKNHFIKENGRLKLIVPMEALLLLNKNQSPVVTRDGQVLISVAPADTREPKIKFDKKAVEVTNIKVDGMGYYSNQEAAEQINKIVKMREDAVFDIPKVLSPEDVEELKNNGTISKEEVDRITKEAADPDATQAGELVINDLKAQMEALKAQSKKSNKPQEKKESPQPNSSTVQEDAVSAPNAQVKPDKETQEKENAALQDVYSGMVQAETSYDEVDPWGENDVSIDNDIDSKLDEVDDSDEEGDISAVPVQKIDNEARVIERVRAVPYGSLSKPILIPSKNIEIENESKNNIQELLSQKENFEELLKNIIKTSPILKLPNHSEMFLTYNQILTAMIKLSAPDDNKLYQPLGNAMRLPRGPVSELRDYFQKTINDLFKDYLISDNGFSKNVLFGASKGNVHLTGRGIKVDPEMFKLAFASIDKDILTYEEWMSFTLDDGYSLVMDLRGNPNFNPKAQGAPIHVIEKSIFV